MQKVHPALLNKHGKSLRHLEVKFMVLAAWKAEHFSALAEKCQALRSLRIPMKLQEVLDGEKEAFIWPDVSPSKLPPPMTAQVQPQKSSNIVRLKRLFSRSQKHSTSSPEPLASLRLSPTSLESRSIHTSLASLHHLTHVHLSVQLEHNSRQLISGERGSTQINHQSVSNLMLRLWRDFGPGSPIEHIEVVFFAPEPSEKIWYYSVCKKARMRDDGIWEGRVVVDVREEGTDYDPRSFDPFRPTYGMQRWRIMHADPVHHDRREC